MGVLSAYFNCQCLEKKPKFKCLQFYVFGLFLFCFFTCHPQFWVSKGCLDKKLLAWNESSKWPHIAMRKWVRCLQLNKVWTSSVWWTVLWIASCCELRMCSVSYQDFGSFCGNFFFFFFFFFFCVPQLYLWGSPLLGEIFAYVTVF